MKLLLTVIMITFANFSMAENAKFTIKPFQGELKLSSPDVTVKSLTLSARIQHCNFWGTPCAGGPREEKTLPVNFKMDAATNLVAFKNSEAITLRSFKPGNRFSSCNLSIQILGVDSAGNKYEGHVGIIHQNNKDVCESATSIKDAVDEFFKVPKAVNLWRY